MFPTDDEVDDLLTHMDQDKSGMVDQEELIRQMSQQVTIKQTKAPKIVKPFFVIAADKERDRPRARF